MPTIQLQISIAIKDEIAQSLATAIAPASASKMQNTQKAIHPTNINLHEETTISVFKSRLQSCDRWMKMWRLTVKHNRE